MNTNRRQSTSRNHKKHRPKSRKNSTSRDQIPKRRPDPQNRKKVPEEEEVFSHIKKRYAVVFYETFQEARDDAQNLLEQAKGTDQLNIVIHAEGPMDDPDLLQYGQIYAGEAWTIIHKRRVEEGWYNNPQ